MAIVNANDQSFAAETSEGVVLLDFGHLGVDLGASF